MVQPSGTRAERSGAEMPGSLRGPVVSKDDINTLAHYYRGEMARMISWRDRIDRTTNAGSGRDGNVRCRRAG